MYIALSLAFVSSFYILFYVKERVCKSKHLQMVSGANVCIFWLTAYVFDIILFMMTIVAILITFICFQEDGFQTTDELGIEILHLLFDVFNYFIFSSPIPAFIWFRCGNAADDVSCFVFIYFTFVWAHLFTSI